jgi:putative sigma-54 modulation protein
MQVQIHARNIDVSQRIREYAEKKLSRLDRYLPHISEVHLDLGTEHAHKGGDHCIAQLTVRNSRGAVLRAEEKKQTDVFAAIDLVIDKMYRQISRYKGKRRRRTGDRYETMEPELAAAEPLPIDEDSEEETGEIVRRKQIDLVPMSEEEAIDQMELLGHDFFMFFNSESGLVNVVYRRDEGGYGLLQPTDS